MIKKHTFSFLGTVSIFAAALVLPLLATAQEAEGVGASSFVNSVSLWVAVIVGLLATAMILRNAQKIKGGVLHVVYNYFGFGLLLIVLGFLAVVLPAWSTPFAIMRTHDFLFIVGCALMAYGAGKMLRAGGIE